MSSSWWSQLRDYWRHLRDSRISLAPTIAIAGLMLVLGDQLLLWLLGWVAPEAAAATAVWSHNRRVLSLGLPMALLFLAVVHYQLWRSLRGHPAQTRELQPQAPLPIVRIDGAEFEVTLAGVSEIARSVPEIPFEYAFESMSELAQWPGRFDPQRWFSAYAHLRPQAGWVLDFVYFYWGNGGHPLLYMRRADEARLRTSEEYQQRFGGSGGSSVASAVAAHLDWDLCPLGALECLLFWNTAARFHLHWHSAAGATEWVVSPAQLQRCADGIGVHDPQSPFPHPFGVSAAQLQSLRSIDPRPEIVLDPANARAQVRVLVREPGVALHWQRHQLDRGHAPRLVDSELVLRHGIAPVY